MGYAGASPVELNGKLCSIVTFGIPIGLHYSTCIASYHATDATAAGHRSTSSKGVEGGGGVSGGGQDDVRRVEVDHFFSFGV